MRLPTWNEFWPFRLIDIETLLVVFIASTRSATRPPHPVENGLSGTLLCHSTCWSLWENNCGGSGTERALYCAFVVGTTSVPALPIKAIWPESNNAFRPVVLVLATSALRLECNAHSRPSPVFGVIPSSCVRGSAIAPRPAADAYAA